MRIAIREQLAALVVFAVLFSLMVLSVPTWVYVNSFVVGVETSGLSLTASLKAAQIASNINLVQTVSLSISSRILIQDALMQFYSGNASDSNWTSSKTDLLSALNSGTADSANLLQGKIYSRNQTGNPNGLFGVTGANIQDVLLPYKAPNGSDVYLSDTDLGYPPQLYPNITYMPSNTPDPLNPGNTTVVARPFPEIRIDSAVNGLVLGPLIINETYALISLTIPIRQVKNVSIVLGYMTIVCEATPFLDVMNSREGLGDTGTVLIVGPTTGWNRFDKYTWAANSTMAAASNFSNVNVHFTFPPQLVPGQASRHAKHDYASGNYSNPWPVTEYPAVFRANTDNNTAVNNASSLLSTTNEQNFPVAVGWARPQSLLVNWTVIVEQDQSEAYAPIMTLRNILLGSVFGTVGLILLLIVPCAHISVLPITRLKVATEKSIAPPGYAEAWEDEIDVEDGHPPSARLSNNSRDKNTFIRLTRLVRRRTRRKPTPSEPDSDPRRRVFKIPGKVRERKHVITDELTELTTIFNEMSEELLRQYTSLDEKVADRTRELEISKKAAEAANESKTLFIANISHELKTPLNGILGMCAVCLEEDDVLRIKSSLKTLYKSGDLLLHLLEDLLSFSKNQIGQQLSLEEREFRLGDIRSQVLTIFDKQVREGKIKFSVSFVSTDIEPNKSGESSTTEVKAPALGPAGTGRLKDMCLWGDQHRILQVLINLVSNSLKFTPPEGSVSVRIKCLHEIEQTSEESRASSFSRSNSNRPGRSRHRLGSGSNASTSSKGLATPQPQYKPAGTALSINPLEPKTAPHISVQERAPTPPPPHAKQYLFEFEVEDSGPGIPEHMQQRVFEPFVQGDLGLSKKYGGTGLGLSICQQLANLMGGHINLRSTPGVGSTFTMNIPLKYTKDRASSTASSSMKSRPPSVGSMDADTVRAAVAQPSAEVKASVLDQQPRLVGLSAPFFASNPNPNTKATTADKMKAIDQALSNKQGAGKLRVLVADDNATNIEVVSKMLEKEDVVDVTIAKDGQEAYDLVKANMEKNLNFDVIFMDIQMPNLDGLQSTRLIRKMGYSAPIVALTAFSEESNVKECMESGMNEFLSKPIRRPALKLVLQKFATIPEEPETASLTRRTTSENGSAHSDRQPSVPGPAPTEAPAGNKSTTQNGTGTPATITDSEKQ